MGQAHDRPALGQRYRLLYFVGSGEWGTHPTSGGSSYVGATTKLHRDTSALVRSMEQMSLSFRHSITVSDIPPGYWMSDAVLVSRSHAVSSSWDTR